MGFFFLIGSQNSLLNRSLLFSDFHFWLLNMPNPLKSATLFNLFVFFLKFLKPFIKIIYYFSQIMQCPSNFLFLVSRLLDLPFPFEAVSGSIFFSILISVVFPVFLTLWNFSNPEIFFHFF